jgi:hypothetical protein
MPKAWPPKDLGKFPALRGLRLFSTKKYLVILLNSSIEALAILCVFLLPFKVYKNACT